LISPVFALTIEFLNFGAKKDGEELYGGVVFFVFSNALEEYDVDGFFVGGLESIDGRRTVLRTPPFPPLDELKGLLFVSLRSPAMLNVFVFFLTNSSSSPFIGSLLPLFPTLLLSIIDILLCTAGKVSFAS
jgi:hypothetical protein